MNLSRFVAEAARSLRSPAGSLPWIVAGSVGVAGGVLGATVSLLVPAAGWVLAVVALFVVGGRRPEALVRGNDPAATARHRITFGWILIVLVAMTLSLVVAGVLTRAESPNGSPRGLDLVFAALVLSLFFLIGRWSLRKGHMTRALAGAAGARDHVADDGRAEEPLAPPRASAAPPFRVEYVRASRLERPSIKRRRVTPEHNVFGDPPVRILHLWGFGDPETLQRYLYAGDWAAFGPVDLLRSFESISAAEYRLLERGRRSEVFAATVPEVESWLATRDSEPSKGIFSRVHGVPGGVVRLLDRRGSYPVNTLLCHDAVWRYAVDRLIEGADLVTLDAAAYGPDSPGLEWELGRLVDRVPTSKFVVLAGSRADTDYLESSLRRLWSSMSHDSPNRRSPGAPIRVLAGRGSWYSARRDARRIVWHLTRAGSTGR